MAWLVACQGAYAAFCIFSGHSRATWNKDTFWDTTIVLAKYDHAIKGHQRAPADCSSLARAKFCLESFIAASSIPIWGTTKMAEQTGNKPMGFMEPGSNWIDATVPGSRPGAGP